MKRIFPLSLAVLCSLFSPASVNAASGNNVYVVSGGADDKIYAVDLATGQTTLVTTNPIGGAGSDLNGMVLTNNTTAYVASFASNNIYRVDLTTGNSFLVNPTPVGFPTSPALTDLALATNHTSVYTGGIGDNNLYLVDLITGASSLVTTTPIGSPGMPAIVGIAIPNSTTAYVVGTGDSNLYRVDLTNGTSSLVTTTPIGSPGSPGLNGMTLASSTTAYVAGGDSNLYFVDLISGNSSLVTPTPVGGTVAPPGIWDIALANSTVAYVTGLDNNVYFVDLRNGSSHLLTPNPIGMDGLYGIAILPIQIQGSELGLKGNNLIFANYLNANASPDVLGLFFLQDNIPEALKSAIPTRNALFTYASQIVQVTLGRIVYDHLVQDRWRSRTNKTPQLTASLDPDELLASRKVMAPKKSTSCKQNKTFISPWVAGFGEYAHEKSQNQTPAFSTGSGGFVAACDYGNTDSYYVGAGVAYAHTHIHEGKNAGHSNVDQGYLLTYGTFLISNWFIDYGVWGGYYHADNVRNIELPSFPGFSAKATLKTHGWQFAPHLGVGYDYLSDNWFGIEPFAFVDWVNCWEHAAQEHGADPLNMGQKGRYCSLLRGEAGLRFQEMLAYSWGTITFLEKGSYGYQKTFHTGTITAFLVGAPGSFTVTTLTGAQNLGIGEFEIRFVPCNKNYPYASLSYQGEFGSKYQSHQGVLTIGFAI